MGTESWRRRKLHPLGAVPDGRAMEVFLREAGIAAWCGTAPGCQMVL